MTTDTNNFSNSVFPSTFEMASRLIEAGVDRDAILVSLYNNYRENRLRLMGFLIKQKSSRSPRAASLSSSWTRRPRTGLTSKEAKAKAS